MRSSVSTDLLMDRVGYSMSFSCRLVGVGDKVSLGDPVCEAQSDKVSFNASLF